MDMAIGTEKTSSIATRHGAFAAINAGFFRLDTSIFAGDSVGVLIINDALLSESLNSRTALVINSGNERTSAAIGHLDIKLLVMVDNQQFSIHGVNRERKQKEGIVYTPAFGRTTLTSPNGTEVVVKGNRITEIHAGKGSTLIPTDGFVLSMEEGFNPTLLLKMLPIKKRTQLIKHFSFAGEGNNRFHAEDVVAGVPLLIKDGKIGITWEQEKASKSFVETRHPRTAVAKMKDGKFLMMTVDGRQPGVSVGMNLNELAEYLLGLGAVDAMNLDGGGSTTMFLDGKVVNKPSDKEGERKVSDAILVTLRKKK